MMSTGEVARGMGVRERTVRRWCEAGFRVMPDGTRSPVSARRMDGRAWLIDAALCWCGAVVLLTPSELDKETAWGRCPCGTSVTHTTWRRQGDVTE